MAASPRNYYEEAVRYALEVGDGDRVACRWIKLACKRFIDDLTASVSTPDSGDFGYFLDIEAASRVAEFIETLPLTKVKGKFPRGQRPKIVLDAWQVFAVVNIFGWKHAETLQRRYREALLFLPRKNGKALDIDTPIPTPSGWSTMGELEVGDEVFDENGAIVRVTAATDVMTMRDCYRVSFADGSSIVADADHQWLAKPAWSAARVVTTAQMAARVRCGAGFYWSLATPGAVQLEQAGLPVDPWVLGFWLGDGSARDARITIGAGDYPEISAEFARGGVSLRPVPSSPLTYWAHDRGYRRKGSLNERLRRLGVFSAKRIPPCYLRASIEQRMALLAGIVDSDGHVTKRGQVEIVTVLPDFAADIIELVRSLGFKASMSVDRARLNGRDCGPRHRIQFWAYKGDAVATLPRKLARLKARPIRTRSRRLSIVSIEPVKTRPVRCIEVDGASRLYLAGRGWTPTHNSEFAAAILLAMILIDGEDAAEGYCGGRNEKQADFIFKAAKRMIKYQPALAKAYNLEVFEEVIAVPATESRILKLVGDPEDGGDPHIYCCDEYHEHPSDSQFDTMKTGMISRLQPLILVTTTAGDIIEGPCYRYVKEAEKALLGALDRPDLFALIYTVDDDVDPASVKALEMANPGYGTLIPSRQIQAEQRTALSSPAKWSRFRIKHLNLWQGAEDSYHDVESWLKNCGQPADDFRTAHDYAKALYESMRGRRCYVGGDLSGKLDLTALVLVFPEANGGFTVIPRFYLPEETLRTRYDPESDVVKWADAGWIDKTEGSMIDILHVCDDVGQFQRDFDVQEVAYDPAHSVAFVQILQKTSAPLIEWPNVPKLSSDPMKLTEGLIREGKVRHDGNPVMSWMVSNVIRKKSTREDLDYPVKSSAASKIDGCTAMYQAVGRMNVAPAQEELFAVGT